MSKIEASEIVANESRMDWISKNVYPKTERAVTKQIKDDYENCIALGKYYRSDKRKDDNWNKRAGKFIDSMFNAYDIRTKNLTYKKVWRLKQE